MRKLFIIGLMMAISNLPAVTSNHFAGENLPTQQKDTKFDIKASRNTADQKLTTDIRNELKAKGFNQITAMVNEGDVTLSGSVRSLAEKERVELQIRGMNGVRGVTSQISIQKSLEMPSFEPNTGR